MSDFWICDPVQKVTNKDSETPLSVDSTIWSFSMTEDEVLCACKNNLFCLYFPIEGVLVRRAHVINYK